MDTRWSRNGRTLALLLSFAVLLALIYAGRALIGPIVIAAFLAYVLNPLVTSVNRRSRLPRRAVVPLLFLVSLGALVGLGALFAPLLMSQGEILSRELQDIGLEFQRLLSERIVVLGFEVDADTLFGDGFAEQFIRSDRVLLVLEAATTNLVWILVILVTTYYLLQDWHRLREWLFSLAPPDAEADLRRLYAEVTQIWQNYLRGQLLLMLLMSLLTGLVLAALGLPGALAVGLLTGLLDIVPTIGPILGMLVAVLVAWFEGSTYLPLSNAWFALLIAGVQFLLQGAENVWLRPQVMGTRLQIHPAVVFIGIVAALSLVGVLGALVVLPVLGTAAVVGSYLRRRILGLPPWPVAGE